MRIQNFLMPTLPIALSNAAQLLFLTIALFALGPFFAALGLALVPLVWLVVTRLNRRLRDYARIGQKQSEEIMTRFIEGVGGYRDLVAAGRFAEAVRAFDRRLDEFKEIQIRTSLVNHWAGFVPLVGFTLFIFAYYIIQTRDASMIGNMEYIGEVISFATLVSMVQGPALGLSRFFTDAALSAPSFNEVRKLLDAPEVEDIPQGSTPARPNIELEEVSFSYAPGAPPILDRVSLEIKEGSFTAIVGQTGSGKSTLFYLLLRLLEPHAGGIRLGGIPLREMSLTDLREYIGFIPQSPFIFDATIRENLCMGVPQDQFEEERINEAIRMARLEKLVLSRQQAGGIDAPVGPGGSTLSGGERQRIALGRIFLRDPQIIVCDEYTANIDNATARLIHEALARVFAGKTRVVITHQLYTVRGADKILVLDRGRIVGTGTHQELIEQGGLYREMWEVQRLE
jgi:ABC-type multidrug transport system fused ATPase/permease subunit